MRDNGKTINLTGRRFGRLIVESRADDSYSSTGRKKINWNCVCDCGSHCVKSSRNLLNDHISSCGCLKSELLTERNKRSSTHGQSHSRLYSVWGGMLGRCRNINNQAYNMGQDILMCAKNGKLLSHLKRGLFHTDITTH